MTKETVQKQNLCVFKSYIIKGDLRSPNLRLYLINKNIPTLSTPKLI